MRTLHTLLLAIGLILCVRPAAAVEVDPATDFDGVYEIEYGNMGFNLHICLNGECLYLNLGAYGNMVTPEEVEEAREQLYADCIQGSPQWFCDWAVDPFVDMAVWYIVFVANLMPETAEVVVDPNPIMFFIWSTGLHGADVYTESIQYDPTTLEPTGESLEGWFGSLLDNNDGDNNGNFGSIGLAFGQPGVAQGIACIPVAAATIGGNIDRDADFDMTGGYGADVEMVCLVSDGVHIGLVNLGLAEAGVFTGTRQ